MGGGWRWRGSSVGCGGCLGNMMGIVLFPIIIVMMLVLSMCNGVDVTVNNGYDEERFQDYANEQYAAEFGNSTAYEDNLLIVFLISEDHYDYNFIAWVGDHVATDINWMFGGNETELGQAMSACINAQSYKYSLDSNLAQVMQTMTKQVQELALEHSFSCDEDHAQVQSHLTNHTDLEMTESTVNGALRAFTDETGIPVVIVVEDMNDVFGKTSTVEGSSISTGAIVVVALVVIVVVVIVVRRKKEQADAQDDPNRRYRDFDDQYK